MNVTKTLTDIWKNDYRTNIYSGKNYNYFAVISTVVYDTILSENYSDETGKLNILGTPDKPDNPNIPSYLGYYTSEGFSVSIYLDLAADQNIKMYCSDEEKDFDKLYLNDKQNPPLGKNFSKIIEVIFSNENTLLDLETKVIEWATARNMYDQHNGGTLVTQLFKLVEEQGEAFSAKLKNKPELLKDGTGDQKVCLINMTKLFQEFGLDQVNRIELWEKLRLVQLAKIGEIAQAILNYDTETVNESIYELDDILKDVAESDNIDFVECLMMAYDEIKDRKGKMVNRTFVKESDL